MAIKPIKSPLKGRTPAKAETVDDGRKKRVEKPALLSATPRAKEVRTHIATYVDAVVKKGRSFSVISRGKSVAVLGPVNSLPKDLACAVTVSTTEIAKGSRTLGAAVHHGPYMVTRGSKNVAVVYAPAADGVARAATLTENISALIVKTGKLAAQTEVLCGQGSLLRDGIQRRVELRQQADQMILRRIAFLRENGRGDDAEVLHTYWKRIDEKPSHPSDA